MLGTKCVLVFHVLFVFKNRKQFFKNSKQTGPKDLERGNSLVDFQ